MSISIEEGRVVIPLSKIIDEMTNEQRKEFAQSASIESDIFDAVVDQIVDGFTQNASSVGSNRLVEARTRIIEAIDPIRVSVIRSLMNDIASLEYRRERDSKWAWLMWHSWPEGFRRPDVPRDFNPQYPTDADVAAKTAET